MAQVLSITEIRYLQYLLQYSLNLKVLYPLPCIPGYKAISNSHQYKSNSCLFAMIQKIWLKMATSLSSSPYTAPQHLVKSIFCLRLRSFCSHHHLTRQVSSAGEVMEHGLSRTIQSCAMRRKGVTTCQQEVPSLPYTVQKVLIFAHLTIDYSITVLHSNL